MTEREPINSTPGDYGATTEQPFPVQLYNISTRIENNISKIHSGLFMLMKSMKLISGRNDNLQLREKIHTTQQEVNACISTTALDIQRLGTIIRHGNKTQKLQVERLTQAFKDSLAKYTSVITQLSEKMAANMPIAARSRDQPGALEQQAIADDEEAQLIANQQAQMRQVEFDSSMMLEREAYMSKIESEVLDVNQIMQDLAQLVNSQAQTVDSVEAHIEAAGADVELGVDELAKAAEYQRRFRKKMFFLSLIGIIFLIIFIVWIVKAFK